MSKTILKPRQNGKTTEDISPVKNGKSHSCSPLKRLKQSDREGDPAEAADKANPAHVDSDDAELARKLHEQLNGPDSPGAAPITRHMGRVRKAPVFYKPEQFGGYQGYHGVEDPEQEAGSGDVSPRPAKEQHVPRELRRLRDHSVSVSDSEAKSSFPAGPRHAPATSLPIPEAENAPAQRPLAARSADHGTKKRSDPKAEGDADTHSRSDAHQRRKQRSVTPELRLTRSSQPPQDPKPHALPADQRKVGRSLPVKVEQPAASGVRPGLNQGSSGSPGGRGTGSSSQKRQGGSKPVAADGEGVAKAEVTSGRLRQGAGGASTSGESQSHVDLAAACPDQADAVGGSGRRGSNSAAAGVSKRAKLPAKNPMVLQKQNGSYYRVRVLKEETYRVKIEFMGFEQQLQPTWLARDSERIWRGSYKNKAWKHLGDGAWEPKSGERGPPLVAHGTHQNQYTKRKALLNGASNNTSSNNDSDDNVGSSEDKRQRDHQHGHCADTGFTAHASAPVNAHSQDAAAAQDPAAAQAKLEGAQPVGESGVLSRLEKSESSGFRAKSRAGARAAAHASSGDSNKQQRHDPQASQVNPHAADGNPQNAGSDPQDADSGDRAVPMDIAERGEDQQMAEASTRTATEDGTAAQLHDVMPPVASAGQVERSRNPSKDAISKAVTARTDRHHQKGKAPAAAKPAGGTATSLKHMDESVVKDDAHTSSACEDVNVASNAAVGQLVKGSKVTSITDQAVKPVPVGDQDSKTAASSGSGLGSKSKGQMGPSGRQQRADKAPSALEAALQCQEDLADDAAAAAASPGDAAPDVPDKADQKAKDDKGKAAAEAEAAPKPVVKPRRDRKGRIRGTYGINAKPVAEVLPESPPAPGVTRASLRPKPTAKASPDDEEMEGAKPAAGLRHPKSVSSGPDAAAAAAAHDSPSSPARAKVLAPEVRRANGRTAIQRRAAAANFAVAAAVAAEAADVMPSSIPHSSRASSKSTGAHRRNGSNGMTRSGLDHVRSGRVSKALSGGSSGAGSCGATMRFGSLLDALGEMESRECGLRQQSHSNSALSQGVASGISGYGGSLRPALFGSGSNGFVSRWHEPLGPVSPKILTLSPELFQLGSSNYASAGWSLPSACHSMVDAGLSLQPQFPLFKAN